ncbi:HIR complex subunit [Rhinocladiella similis]
MALEGRSSSNDLSSAPASDAESTPGPLSYLTAHRDALPPSNLGMRDTGPPPATPAGQATKPPPQPTSQAELKAKRSRKKKDPNAPEPEKKEKAPKKPRVVGVSRKKPKLEPAAVRDTIDIAPAYNPNLQSSTLNQPFPYSPPPAAPHPQPHPQHVAYNVRPPGPDSTMYSQQAPPQQYDPMPPVPQPAPAAPAPRSMYDPIRSMTISRLVDPVPSAPVPQPSQTTPPRPTYNPSTSPAISGIIDHPAIPARPASSAPPNAPPSAPSPYGKTNGKSVTSPRVNGNSAVTPIEITDSDPDPPVKKSAPAKKTPSEAPTRATSPKPTRAKEQQLPPPPGSGLLSASLFGGDSGADANQKDAKGPNIVIHVDLKDPKNHVINFARLAEEKYGFAALYPRQAAQRERLAKVAAAGAALERSASGSKFGGTSAGESGDEDLSVDIDRDSDNDGDVAMSGVNGQDATNSGTDAPEPKKKRKRKVEEYDQDDPFVDDSELLWEAQAAASKDGFFVYCGPLVPEGEKPAVERADGTIKRGRGRGRGGGPGSRGGRAGAASDRPNGRGGGPGSRGGGITRKPRITKAERAQRESEKAEREKIAPLVAKPAAYPG